MIKCKTPIISMSPKEVINFRIFEALYCSVIQAEMRNIDSERAFVFLRDMTALNIQKREIANYQNEALYRCCNPRWRTEVVLKVRLALSQFQCS